LPGGPRQESWPSRPGEDDAPQGLTGQQMMHTNIIILRGWWL
jgi:hypothetical protein